MFTDGFTDEPKAPASPI